MQLYAGVLIVIVTIYIYLEVIAHNLLLLTVQIGGYGLFNVNVTCKECDIIFMLTCSLNNSNIFQ